MNKTLIIYDNKGIVISQVTGNYKIPNGLPYIEVEIPNDKYVESVDVETKKVIYGDIPKTEIETLNDKISILTEENEKLKQELALTQDAVNEILFMMMNMEVK